MRIEAASMVMVEKSIWSKIWYFLYNITFEMKKFQSLLVFLRGWKVSWGRDVKAQLLIFFRRRKSVKLQRRGWKRMRRRCELGARNKIWIYFEMVIIDLDSLNIYKNDDGPKCKISHFRSSNNRHRWVINILLWKLQTQFMRRIWTVSNKICWC